MFTKTERKYLEALKRRLEKTVKDLKPVPKGMRRDNGGYLYRSTITGLENLIAGIDRDLQRDDKAKTK